MLDWDDIKNFYLLASNGSPESYAYPPGGIFLDNKPIKIRDARTKDKFQIDDVYLNGYAKICGWNATLAYLCLCRHANYHTQEAFPSIEMMAEKIGVSKNSIKRGIIVLKQHNIIDIKREKNEKGQWERNTYTLLDKSIWIVQGSVGAVEIQGSGATEIQGSVVTTKDSNSINATNNICASFEELWNLYPRRLGKKQAFRHYKQSVRSLKDIALLRAALQNYKDDIKRNKTPEKYIKHGSTWFNNWHDWIDVPESKPKSKTNEQLKAENRCIYCKYGHLNKDDEGLLRCSDCNASYGIPN